MRARVIVLAGPSGVHHLDLGQHRHLTFWRRLGCTEVTPKQAYAAIGGLVS